MRGIALQWSSQEFTWVRLEHEPPRTQSRDRIWTPVFAWTESQFFKVSRRFFFSRISFHQRSSSPNHSTLSFFMSVQNHPPNLIFILFMKINKPLDKRMCLNNVLVRKIYRRCSLFLVSLRSDKGRLDRGDWHQLLGLGALSIWRTRKSLSYIIMTPWLDFILFIP